ncbi:carboxymuconolactone decarboxylase family protein [Novosphingobium sp.]|uniref:carboxymuconolactone decarboxylase family protein n=1 Tax=Novosphingobium sp. TaxID=1874826 RepID=UPI002610D6ED|nr:carboxymuconolactone decarboxylase family protein [Novosphingobium sp.]
MTNQLAPLAAPYPPEVAAILAGYPQQDGYILSLFRTFANSVRFLRKGVPNLLDRESPLPLRMREIVILRTTANRRCEYEWGVHVSYFAKAARLSPEQIAATTAAAIDPALWSETEAGLLAAIDALCRDGRMDDTLHAAFTAAWTKEQQLEIFALCGAYHTVSFVANAARLPGEPFGTRFPESAAS